MDDDFCFGDGMRPEPEPEPAATNACARDWLIRRSRCSNASLSDDMVFPPALHDAACRKITVDLGGIGTEP